MSNTNQRVKTKVNKHQISYFNLCNIYNHELQKVSQYFQLNELLNTGWTLLKIDFPGNPQLISGNTRYSIYTIGGISPKQ